MIVLSFQKVGWCNIQKMKKTALLIFSISYVERVKHIEAFDITVEQPIYFFLAAFFKIVVASTV
ncbi:hypothetical protein NZ708_29375 (plasmid) [Pseudomonas syringae pv. actinidiae ICMP 18708]